MEINAVTDTVPVATQHMNALSWVGSLLFN